MLEHVIRFFFFFYSRSNQKSQRAHRSTGVPFFLPRSSGYSPHNCPHSGRVHRTNSFRYTTHWQQYPESHNPWSSHSSSRFPSNPQSPYHLYQHHHLHLQPPLPCIPPPPTTTSSCTATPPPVSPATHPHHVRKQGHQLIPAATLSVVPDTHHLPKNGRNCTHGAGGP